MSAAVAQAPVQSSSSRRFPRFSIATPVDVLVLRSGIPESIPGRSLNVSEAGMAAVFAAELRPGQIVGVEMAIPDSENPVRAKAIVKHQTDLLCGLEFQSLSQEQRALLRTFGGQPLHDDVAADSEVDETAPANASKRVRGKRGIVRYALSVALILSVGVLALGWWQWQQSYKQLEAQSAPRRVVEQRVRVAVPAREMQKLLLRKIDPIYPESAREDKLRGIVVLNAVVGRDGSVLSLEPVSGPDILASAATDAIRWWRFQPYEVNGKPEEVETTLAVEFTP